MMLSDEITAYHEAGHAVAYMVLGVGAYVKKVSIKPQGYKHKASYGHVLLHKHPVPRGARELVRYLLIKATAAYAGSQAELVALIDAGCTPDEAIDLALDSSADDRKEAKSLLGTAKFLTSVAQAQAGHGPFPTRIRSRKTNLCLGLAMRLVLNNWAYVATVAEVLLAEGQITGEELMELCT